MKKEDFLEDIEEENSSSFEEKLEEFKKLSVAVKEQKQSVIAIAVNNFLEEEFLDVLKSFAKEILEENEKENSKIKKIISAIKYEGDIPFSKETSFEKFEESLESKEDVFDAYVSFLKDLCDNDECLEDLIEYEEKTDLNSVFLIKFI